MKEFIRTILIAVLVIGPTVTFSVPIIIPELKWAVEPTHSEKSPETIYFKVSDGSGNLSNIPGENAFDIENPTAWKFIEIKNTPCINTCMQKRDGYGGKESPPGTKTT